MERSSARTSPVPAARAGFTAIEMMVVLAVVVILLGSSAPSLLHAIRAGRVNQVANVVLAAHDQARSLAIEHPTTGPERFGVFIDNSASPPYVAVTYGRTASAADIYTAAGEPVFSRELNPGVTIQASGRDITTFGWRYESRTGFPIDTAGRVVSIGVPSSPLSPSLLDGFSARAIAGGTEVAMVVLDSGVGYAQAP